MLANFNSTADRYGRSDEDAVAEYLNVWTWTPIADFVPDRIAGRPTDGNGEVFLVATTGQPLDASITPKGNHNGADVFGGSSELKITWSSDENIIGKTQSAVVGQLIGLECMIGNSTVGMEFEWTVSGYAVAGYSADVNAGVLNTNIVTTNSSASFYWVDGGAKSVSCKVKYRGQELSGMTTFEVFRPNGKITTRTNSVTVDNNYHLGLALHFGNLTSPSNAGILWSNSIPLVLPSGYSGHSEWVQLFNGTSTFDLGTEIYTTNRFGFDPNIYPVVGEWDQDSPGTQLNSTFNSLTRNDNFELWLMFKPDISSSIAVPLRKLNWSWSGTASYTNGNWSGGGTANVSSDFNTTNHPVWTQNWRDPK